MTSYSVSCKIHATDNDHFKLAELRIAQKNVPEFVTGLRALATGTIERLYLCDAKQKAVITGEGLSTYTLMFEMASNAYMCEQNLYEMETFALERLFEKQKPTSCLSLELAGEDDLQISLSIWIVSEQSDVSDWFKMV